MDNYSKIMGFLSSSEINRCKRNGLKVWEANNWVEVLKYDWLTRKLRRKIGHMFTLDILLNTYKPIIGIDSDNYLFELPQFRGMFDHLAQQFLDAEDHYILTGKMPNES